MMERFHILIFYTLFMASASGEVDYRRTVIKPGFGVNFERVGHIITAGGITQYQKTWVIKIPTFAYEEMPLFNCTDATDWRSRCTSINELIGQYNGIMYERVSMAKRMVMAANLLIPKNATRTKRDTYDDMPDWLKSNTNMRWLDYMPFRIKAQIWADLTHTPGARATRQLREHLRQAGRGMYWNIRGIQQLNNDISAFSVLEFNQTEQLRRGMEGVNHRLNQVRRSMQHAYAKIGSEDERLMARIQFELDLNGKLFGDVMVEAGAYIQHAINMYQSAQMWQEGIRSVVKGYLSPYLVTVEDVKEIIQYIQTHVLSQPRYSDLCLMNSSPMFYYQLMDIAYTRDDRAIYLGISIPLYRTAGLLPVYRVDVYDVPIHSGTMRPPSDILETNDPSEESYTRIHNLPDYLVISDDQQTYLEISKAFFLTCRGKSTAYLCGSGTPALKKPTVKSCAFAIFTEDKAAALKACDVRFETGDNWQPYGSAIQIAADQTFLIHRSNRAGPSDTWQLQCPESAKRPQTTLTPCNLCRIEIPCSCTITANDFFLPKRYTGCMDWDKTESTEVTYAYHLNTIAVNTLYPTSAHARINSYQAKLNAKWPPFEHPNISFSRENNWNDYVELSEKYKANYTMTIERGKKEQAIFVDAADAALQRTRNFGDQVVDREGNVAKAIKDLIYGVFGDDVLNVITFVFGPMGLACMAFLLSLAVLVPNIGGTLHRMHRRRKAARQYTYLVSSWKEMECSELT